ncbi:Alpha-soluble NSF attachment protein, partial [Stegodyphus mimosarum]
MKEGCGWQNGMKLSLRTSHASVCNTTMVGFVSGERMLNSYDMHCHTDLAPGIMVWGGIGYRSCTRLVRIAGTLNSQCYISEVLEPVVLPYVQGLPRAIFQQDNAPPHVARIVQGFFVNCQIELLPWLACCPDLSPIENMWSMVAERLTQITSQAATPAAGSAFSEAASLRLKMDNRHDAAACYIDAGNCYKKSDPHEAIKCILKAIEFYTDMGRFTVAAKHHMTVAEIYETEMADIEKAMHHYEQAADYFRGEESNRCSESRLQVIHMPSMEHNVLNGVERNPSTSIHTIVAALGESQNSAYHVLQAKFYQA